MRRGITRVDVLGLGISVIMLAPLMFASFFGRRGTARESARLSNCRANLHNLGLGLAMLADDHRDLWPGWVTEEAEQAAHQGIYLGEEGAIPPQPWVQAKGGPMFQLYSNGYIEGLAVFDCTQIENPTADWSANEPQLHGKDDREPYSQADRCISGCEYGYDLGRISSRSNPARIVMGDLQEIEIDYDGTGWDAAQYDDPHPDGANVLFFDNAVQWAQKLHPELEWRRDQLGDPRAAGTTFGYIPNPRLDEDGHYDPNNADLKDDIDDIYCIECDSAEQPFDLDGASPGQMPGVLCPLSYEQRGPADPGRTLWRPHINDGSIHNSGRRKYHFEQRGPYAVAPRWDKYDTRLVAGPPFYMGGGPGIRTRRPAPALRRWLLAAKGALLVTVAGAVLLIWRRRRVRA